jgi:flagellar hook-associated protein 1 FlgK
MSLFSTLGIGRSGLQAASIGLETISHNVANSGVEGFHRRSVESNNPSARTHNGYMLGQGVNVSKIRRAQDQFLGVRVIESAGISSAASTLSGVLSGVEEYFNEANSSGVNETLQEFFDSFTAVTADPGDHGLRQSLSSTSTDLAETVVRTAVGLDSTIIDLEKQMESYVDQANTLVLTLASVNEAINASGDPVGAGDLLDERDRLAQQISTITGGKISYGESGQVNLYVGGHAIVSGVEWRELSVGTDTNGDPKILMETGGGNVDVTSVLEGTLGGSLEAREITKGYLDSLNTFASTFADAINTQHAAGFDLNGTIGADVFTFAVGNEAMSLDFSSAIADDDSQWALAGTSAADIGDATNLKLLIDIEGTSLFTSGTETSGEFLGSLLNTVAADVTKANNSAQAAAAHADDVEGLMASLTGVDLDQEAISLIEFQAAYQASAKVIQAADQMLQVLLNTI